MELNLAFVPSLHHRDSQILVQCGRELRTYAPGAVLAARTFNALFAHPDVCWDSAALVKVIKEMTGFPACDSGTGTR